MHERNETTEIAVVGGGMIGLCTALYLARNGHRVTVLDREADGEASTGNAGMIVPSHVVPLAAPGVIAKGLRWLTNAESPFYVKPRLDVDLARWLWQFRAACTAAHVERSVPLLRDLSLASVALFEELAALGVLQQAGYDNTGLLMLYHSEQGRAENMDAADQAEAAGLDIARLRREEVLDLDPGIRVPVDGGVLYRQDGRVAPDRMLDGLAAHLARDGAEVRRGVAVQGFERTGSRVKRLELSEGTLEVDEVVIAAGAWSGVLVKQLGVDLPLQPAKGYSVTLEAPDQAPAVPHILSEEKLTVTPLPGRLRFAGTLALAGFDGSISSRRTAALHRLVHTYCPDAGSTADESVWHGFRPCSPDGLPFIGRVEALSNLIIATGHGMMGVTLGPITGKLVAELIDGKAPSLNLDHFAVHR